MESIWSSGIVWNIFLQNLGSWLKTPMEFFSFLGNEYFFILLLPALYWCLEASIGVRVGFILLMSTSLNEAIKLAFHGPRPYWYSQAVQSYSTETSFGAPSGHSQIAASVWGMFPASLRKWWAWLVAVLIIFLIGVSRIYLGVHFLTDVVLGWVIGVLILWLVLVLWNPIATWLKKMHLGHQILVSFLSSLALILISSIPFFWLKITNWQAPPTWASYAKEAISLSGTITATGTFFGFFAGLAWFSHHGGFNPQGPVWKLIMRYFIGLIGVLVFYLGLKVLFGMVVPDSEALLPYIVRYIRYALVGAWVSAGAPWIFVKLKLADPLG
jgi:membrane-associated phospholipid phosphatase